MKKVLSLVLALALVLCVPAFAAFAEGENISTELRLAMASPPETIDPNRNSAVDGAVYAIHNFEGLMRYGWTDGTVEYGMAESYDISEDGLVWTFHLRDSKWSDGEPVKAADFVFSWQRLVSPELACPYAMDMGAYIKNGAAIVNGEMDKAELGVKAIDDKTLEVTLEAACPYFAELSAFPVFMPLRQDIIEKYGDDNWVKGPESYISNGPFKMESFSLDEDMVSVPNEGYWDVASVVPTKITWLFLPDDKANLAALRAGEADLIDAVPQEEVQALKADGLYDLRPELGTYYVSFNNEKAPFDNVLVRKAFALAIDTDYVANVNRQGEVLPAGAFVGNGFFTSNYDKEFRPETGDYINPSTYEENVKAAQEALAEAGYPNGEGFPKVEYSYNESSVHASIAEAMQKMWADALNVNVELRSLEWGVFTADRREGNYEMARNGWIGDYNDPATMLTLKTSTSGNNDEQYKSEAYDAKIAESMAEADPAKRNQLLHEAEDILMADWVCAPVYYYTDGDGVSKQLTDWGKMPLGYKMFHKAYLDLSK